jgi:hypothetical protein
LYGVTLPNKEKGYTDYPVHQAWTSQLIMCLSFKRQLVDLNEII